MAAAVLSGCTQRLYSGAVLTLYSRCTHAALTGGRGVCLRNLEPVLVRIVVRMHGDQSRHACVREYSEYPRLREPPTSKERLPIITIFRKQSYFQCAFLGNALLAVLVSVYLPTKGACV